MVFKKGGRNESTVSSSGISAEEMKVILAAVDTPKKRKQPMRAARQDKRNRFSITSALNDKQVKVEVIEILDDDEKKDGEVDDESIDSDADDESIDGDSDNLSSSSLLKLDSFESPLNQFLSLRLDVDRAKTFSPLGDQDHRRYESCSLLVDWHCPSVNHSTTKRPNGGSHGRRPRDASTIFSPFPVTMNSRELMYVANSFVPGLKKPPRAVKGYVNLLEKSSVVSLKDPLIQLDPCYIMSFWFYFRKWDFTKDIWKAICCSAAQSKNIAQKALHLTFYKSGSQVAVGLYVPKSKDYGVSYPFQDDKTTLDLSSIEEGWHHISMVSDGLRGVSRLYLDGFLAGTAAASCNIPISFLGNSGHDSGNGEEKPFPPFADFRLYNLGDRLTHLWERNIPQGMRNLVSNDEFEAYQMHNFYRNYSTPFESVYPKRAFVAASPSESKIAKEQPKTPAVTPSSNPSTNGAAVKPESAPPLGSSSDGSARVLEKHKKKKITVLEDISRESPCGVCEHCNAKSKGKCQTTEQQPTCTFASSATCRYCPMSGVKITQLLNNLKVRVHSHKASNIGMSDIVSISFAPVTCPRTPIANSSAKRRPAPRFLLKPYLVNGSQSWKDFHGVLDPYLRACHLKRCTPESPQLEKLLASRGRKIASQQLPSDSFISVLMGCANGSIREMYKLICAIEYLSAVWLVFLTTWNSKTTSGASKAVAGVYAPKRKSKLANELLKTANLQDLHLARGFCERFREEISRMTQEHLAQKCSCFSTEFKQPCAVVVTGLAVSPVRSVISVHSKKLANELLSDCNPKMVHEFFVDTIWGTMPCILCNEGFAVEDLVAADQVVACNRPTCTHRCHASCRRRVPHGGPTHHAGKWYGKAPVQDGPWYCNLCTLDQKLCRAMSLSDHGRLVQLINEGASPFARSGEQGETSALHIAATHNDVTGLNIILSSLLQGSSHTRSMTTYNADGAEHKVPYYQVFPLLALPRCPRTGASPLLVAMRAKNLEFMMQISFRLSNDAALRTRGAPRTELLDTDEEAHVIQFVQQHGRLPSDFVKHPENDFTDGAELVQVPWERTPDSKEIIRKTYLCNLVEHSSVLVNWTKVRAGQSRGCQCACDSHGSSACGRGCDSFHKQYSSLPVECNQYCSCARDGYRLVGRRQAHTIRYPNCGRRSVQNGVTMNMRIFKTDNGRGWGVKAAQFIPEGTFLAEYVGELVSEEELRRRESNSQEDSVYTWDIGFCNSFHIDGTRSCGISAFFNHACSNANVTVARLFSKLHQDKRAATVAFFASKDIYPEEEMCCDYKQGAVVADLRTKGSKMFNICKCAFCEKERSR